MADEPRRSGRATKGQHKHASSSPPPAATKPTKTAKSKPSKKSQEPEPGDDDGKEEEEEIRCICGNNNPKDKRAFIGCDSCTVWQHNVCMGITDDTEDQPDHYFCEGCAPGEHQETIQALARGEKIWETRNKIYQNEKKMSKNRKGRATVPLGWLKKDVIEEADQAASAEPVDGAIAEEQETGSKRKREEVKEEPSQEVEDEKPTRATRQDKRRKSAAPEENAAQDTETALVPITKLPADRQKIATALSKIITDVIGEQVKGGFNIPEDHTAKSLGDELASLMEYELQMVHGGPSNPPYMGQFRALNANLKKNKVLVERILKGSLSANELATMESKDMASEELQKERAAMKEVLDRQAVAVQEEGPRYRRTHKGDELIEDENQHLTINTVPAPQPVRERVSGADDEEETTKSPSNPAAQAGASDTSARTDGTPFNVETSRPPLGHERRQSSQNFDMNNIWAKTAGSPTNATGPRPLQMPPRRRSSANLGVQEQAGGTKHDADIDRMLQDDDEPYSPADASGNEVVWRGKVVLTADNAEPTVSARWVAGRDMREVVPWRSLLPQQLTIDGRLQIAKAEAYLCSLQWSNNIDVSVLALSPFDDAEAFASVFQYFKSRERYAVINKDKPATARDLYIIPIDVGDDLPKHLTLLEHCSLKSPAEEKLLLATLVSARADETPPATASQEATSATISASGAAPAGTNGQHLPQHVRGGGPAGSPMAPQGGVFSPSQSGAAPPAYGIPPNPYTPTPPPPAQPGKPAPGPSPYPNPLVAEVLGPLQFAPTVQEILVAQPGIDRNRLENLRRIMEETPETQTDLRALAMKLG